MTIITASISNNPTNPPYVQYSKGPNSAKEIVLPVSFLTEDAAGPHHVHRKLIFAVPLNTPLGDADHLMGRKLEINIV